MKKSRSKPAKVERFTIVVRSVTDYPYSARYARLLVEGSVPAPRMVTTQDTPVDGVPERYAAAAGYRYRDLQHFLELWKLTPIGVVDDNVQPSWGYGDDYGHVRDYDAPRGGY